MALQVVKWPRRIIRGTTSIGTFTAGSSIISVNATVYAALSVGDEIYITNNEAVGFWYFNKVAAGQITIREYQLASAYTFVGSGTFTFYIAASSTYSKWNAVHLPIVYKLLSTLWPTNSVDTSRTVSSYANDNGYVKLTLSGAITSSVTELEFIKITGGSAGIYQIIAFYSTSIVTINLAYSGSAMTFGTVQYYYNNYRARIRVYAGIKSTHTYTLQKPYALITEQEVKPDSTGVITFNINEFLKQKLDILKNDMLKGTLPNNLDAWCMFYITYAECYDYSAGGYTLLDNIGAYTDDSGNFEGYAVNADLPFKNVYSGSMTDYISYGVQLEKFLTPVLYPEITGAFYFDISYVIDETINLTGTYLIQKLYSNNILTQTIYNVIGTGSTNWGVYRSSLTKQNTEDTQQIFIGSQLTLLAPSAWTDDVGFWTSKTATQFNRNFIGTDSVFSYQALGSSIDKGATVLINFTVTITGFSGTNVSVSFAFVDGSNGGTDYTPLYLPGSSASSFTNSTAFFTADGTYNLSLSITANDSLTKRLYLACSKSTGNANVTITISPGVFGTNPYSETKTISINSGFFNSGFAPYTNYNVGWLNYLSGFDWKVFQSSADFGVNIEGTKTVNKNIFQNWPTSFGEGADTIKQETVRSSRQTITLRAENLTSDQVTDLFRIKTSPLVQIVTSANDRRTIIPDKSSFVYLKQREKLFSFEFTAEFTDNLSSQGL